MAWKEKEGKLYDGGWAGHQRWVCYPGTKGVLPIWMNGYSRLSLTSLVGGNLILI